MATRDRERRDFREDMFLCVCIERDRVVMEEVLEDLFV
jgi:hypothetical protein